MVVQLWHIQHRVVKHGVLVLKHGDTYQDRLANFTTDTNRPPSINNYLINKIKVTSFYNTIRRAADDFKKHKYTNEFTNANKFTKRFSNNISDEFTWRDFNTTRNSFTVLHTYLDDSTRKSALFSWKAAANLYNVLNSFLVMILSEYFIDLQMDLAKTRFRFLGSHLVEYNKYLDQ